MTIDQLSNVSPKIAIPQMNETIIQNNLLNSSGSNSSAKHITTVKLISQSAR